MIPKNAITMTGDIEQCWLIAYRVTTSQLISLVPKPLEVVTMGDFGFINIVVSRLSHMRPIGIPAFLGMGYWHVAYRTYVRFSPNSGDPIEGLYFLRSEATSPLMVGLGNMLTDFRFHQCDVQVAGFVNGVTLTVSSKEAPGSAKLDYDTAPCLSSVLSH